LNLVHYIIVRKDLPIGVLAAMVTHAAGESAAQYEAKEGWRYDSAPCFTGATAVVLQAENEYDLVRIGDILSDEEIPHVDIHESDGAYHGQLMAIGVRPASREALSPRMRAFRLLTECGCRLTNPAGGRNVVESHAEKNPSTEVVSDVAGQAYVGCLCPDPAY
jgi:peptidyl-tRNA hydrolase